LAASEILISIPEQVYNTPRLTPSSVCIHGILSNRIKYEYTLEDNIEMSKVLGKVYDGWWAKAMVPRCDNAPPHVLVAKKEGRHILNRIVAPSELDYLSGADKR
jgi:hypothetical protein